MIKFKFLLLISLLVSIHSVVEAAPFDGAKWISFDSEISQPNQWLCFRKCVSINKIDTNAELLVAVDSKYWLWINGKLVIFEGGLKRGPTPTDTYYDRINVSKYLKKGNNTIAILTWYWGKDGYCHKNSGKPGLLVRLSSSDTTIDSDRSWKVCVHPAFGETSAPKPNYRLPESNVRFDARKDMGNWYDEQYDDKQWKPAAELGVYPCKPWNNLHLRPFPNWKDLGRVKYERVTKEMVNDTLIVKGKLPRNITVTPYLKLRSESGLLIDIRSDNYKGGSEYNVRTEYITKDGVQSFEMPNYINGHTIIYKLPKGVNVLDVGYRETRFDTEHLGRFWCSDEFYNKLWEKSLNTMNLNMRDAIQDPDRERSQWWGDVAIILHEIFYTCDTNGHASVKKAICNLVDWQKADGTLYSPIPAGSWNGELPLQMLASVGKYGFWSYYWYSGDLEGIKYVYPHVKKYLSLWKINEKGLVEHRAGGWDWADWGQNIDVPILDNAWYCLALESTIEMAKLVHDDDFATHCASQLDRVRKASRQTFWNGNLFRSSDYKGKTDDRANGLAILAGFADKEQRDKITDFLMSYAGASPYMEKYILEALFDNGKIEQALERIKKRYRNMVESPLTTVWEDWKVGGAGGGSINHGWAGGTLALLPRYVAGIYPLEPGWNKFMIKPQLGLLEWVECSVPVFNKMVNVSVKCDKYSWTLDVDNRTGKECIVALPRKYMPADGDMERKAVCVNGKTIDKSNAIIDTIRRDDEFLYVKLKQPKIKIKLRNRP